MTVDATPPPQPPPPPPPPPPHLPPPELPPDLVAEYLESARSQLGVLAGLAERLLVAAPDPPKDDAPRRETHKGPRAARAERVLGTARPPGGQKREAHRWTPRHGT